MSVLFVVASIFLFSLCKGMLCTHDITFKVGGGKVFKTCKYNYKRVTEHHNKQKSRPTTTEKKTR